MLKPDAVRLLDIDLVAKRATGFNLEIELKNIILRRDLIFKFLHSQGQIRTSSLGAARPLPPGVDIGPGAQSVGQAAQFCLVARTRG